MPTSTPASETDSLGALELTELAGVSYRQVDYWTRLGRLRAFPTRPGSGYPRLYAPTEVCVARVLRYVTGLPIADRDLERLLEWVRAGLTGRYMILPGVVLDLDVLCADDPAGVALSAPGIPPHVRDAV